MDGWVNLGTPLGDREGGLRCPKCGWCFSNLILAANVESIVPTKGKCFGNEFLKYLEMPEYVRALTMVAPK